MQLRNPRQGLYIRGIHKKKRAQTGTRIKKMNGKTRRNIRLMKVKCAVLNEKRNKKKKYKNKYHYQ
jgi:hypothetical protein